MGKQITVNAWLNYQQKLHNKTIDLSLGRVRKIYKLLFPNGVLFKVITIAGTNGKGSTAAFIDSIYTEANFKVAKFSSPHIIKYNERFTINGVAVSDDDICDAFNKIDKKLDSTTLTYFEFSTLAALIIFSKHRVDLAILEIGLGGRLDSVNVVTPDISVITNIAIDHTEYLGTNREQIGYEKAAIMRPNKICIYGDKTPVKSIINHAKKIQAKLIFTSKLNSFKLGLKGAHQKQNAAAAIAVTQALNKKFLVNHQQIKNGLKNTFLLGRIQEISINNKTIILDGAHNVAATKTLANYLKKDNIATIAIFFALKDKNISQMLKQISAIISKWLIAPIDVDRALNIYKLQEKFSPQDNVELCQDINTAINQAIFHQQFTRIVIFGSFYIIASAINIIKKSYLPQIQLY